MTKLKFNLWGTIFLAVGLFLVYLGIMCYGGAQVASMGSYNVALAPNWVLLAIGGVLAAIGLSTFRSAKKQ
jgi:hypothetical protein